jgi:hypothetical protein
MFLVRTLVLLALKFNILFSAKHLPGKVNIYSDALSRLQVSKFQTLMPQADLQPTRIVYIDMGGWESSSCNCTIQKLVNSDQTLLCSFLVESTN